MTQQEKRDEIVAHYERVRAELLASFEGLTDEQLSEPQDGAWSVKDNLAHLTVWDEIRIAEIERIAAGGLPAWPPQTPEQNETFNNITADFRRSLPASQVVGELKSARARLLALVRTCGERALDESLYGEAPLRSSHDLDHANDIREWRAKRGI